MSNSQTAGLRSRRGESRSRVYDLLLAEILSLRLEPASPLDEAELATSFGVSRTPLREAIIRLSGEGLVQLRPNRSPRVAPMDVHNLREYHEASELLHRVMARWAATRSTPADLDRIEEAQRALEAVDAEAEPWLLVSANVDFHSAIGAAAHNRHVADAYERLLREGQRLSSISLTARPGAGEESRANREHVIREHRAIMLAIRNRDAEAADRHAAEHSRHGRERLMRYLAQSGAGEVRLHE